MDTLPIRIRESRKLRGFSQRELADMVGVTKSAISQYESTSTSKSVEPTIKNALKIAEALDISFEWLATGNGIQGIEEFLVDIKKHYDDDDRLVLLTEEQKRIVAIFGDLPKDWQDKYALMLKAIHSSLSEEQEKSS